MTSVTTVDFESYLRLGHETNGVEFKGHGRRTLEGQRKDSPFFAKVVRAILGMANRRDGGLVILGVDDTTLEAIGLSEEELKTWSNYDVLAESVNKYANPSVRFDFDSQFIYDSKRFVIFDVKEFDDIPILCSKEFQDSGNQIILRIGACYVRSRHKPETAEIRSQEEMRELLELAIDKGVRRFVTRAEKAGLFSAIRSPAATPSDEELFRRQIEDLG